MKFFSSILMIIGAMVSFSACSPTLTPFTQKIYEENAWTETDLKKIQFYLSQDITLYRDVTEGKSKIEEGRVRMVKGRKIEEVIIHKGTPGVFVTSPKNNRFGVSFENGSNERFLMFGPNPKKGNKYVLLAKEWKRHKGTLSYEGKTYYTNAENAYAALMIDLKKTRNTSIKSRRANGRKL